ncbi:response regulator transcription factor [Salipaludibacillus aurantiacus]|uniref:Two-component system, OmpR family, response regulator ResD n=1 Tax=Salipaludibacillus aurantiacus TaxID=1601833 RepID=A0A1H9V062_9BACI|nr:response regulator transcription factor [Salipaludibacillus aurantiacus]SES15160.1 two-component system, OmpR family, response regulator ResD [Salipaludibacillus aurantiacus]
MAEERILIVDDEQEMRTLLKLCLADKNYIVSEAVNGTEAMEVIRGEKVDLVLLDIMMPEVDGFELLKMLREELNRKTPVILLSALGDTERVVKGLQLGADDYIVKPFEPRELTARVESVLRRSFFQKNADLSFEMKGLQFYPNKYQIFYNNKALPLTKKEFSIFHRLATNPGRVYSREQLLNLEWEMAYEGDLRTVDTHIKNIREKLKSEGYKGTAIDTVWGVGYKVDEDVSAADQSN